MTNAAGSQPVCETGLLAVDLWQLGAAVSAEKGKGSGRKSAAEEHKAQLEALKLQDPDFYKYLQQADQELLNFGAQEEESSDKGAEEVSPYDI